MQDLERGSSKPEYKAAEPPPLDHIPLPDLTLIRPTQYSAMAIQYSREYPLNDEFGDLLEGFWRPHRTKSVAQVIIELEQLYHRKWRGPVFLVEDNLIGNKRNVKPLLAAVAEWNSLRRRPFAFFTQASVYLADDSELLELMKDAGFIRVIVGIDSSVPTHTKGPLKRRHTDRTLYERVRCIQQYGIEVMAASTVGIEHNTEEKFDPPNNYIQ